VQAKAERLGVHSPTGASADTFRAYERLLVDLETAFPAEPGQCGAVLALGDRFCLDWVSRPEAFARLWPKLRRGYLIDALERLDGAPTPSDRVAGFVDEISNAVATRRPSVGLGEDLRLDGEGVIGSGLELDGKLLQLSALTTRRETGTAGRIARPSRRAQPRAMDVRDAEAGQLLQALLEEVRLLREQTTALLEAILAKLADIERTQYS
jgi:hypothetical protein